jgi:hypothetical protein
LRNNSYAADLRIVGVQHLIKHAVTAPLQVREVRCHYSTATGPGAARSMAQQLWQGEEYVLQIDAHMRFVQVSVSDPSMITSHWSLGKSLGKGLADC